MVRLNLQARALPGNAADRRNALIMLCCTWLLHVHMLAYGPRQYERAVHGRVSLRPGTVHSLLLKLEFDDFYAALRGVPPSICVDVGGHIGHTAAQMAKHGHETHVFEPFEGNLAQLRAAVAKYGDQVHVYHGAVSEISGTRLFNTFSTGDSEAGYVVKNDTEVVIGDHSYSAKAGTSATGALKNGLNKKDQCTPGEDPGCVLTYSLDVMFPTQHLLMLKIDVQGGEPNVLMGAKRLMNEQRISYIYLEYTMMNGPWSGNYPIQQNNSPHVILKMMDAAGYMCFDHAGLFPFDKDEFFPRCEQDWCESHVSLSCLRAMAGAIGLWMFDPPLVFIFLVLRPVLGWLVGSGQGNRCCERG